MIVSLTEPRQGTEKRPVYDRSSEWIPTHPLWPRAGSPEKNGLNFLQYGGVLKWIQCCRLCGKKHILTPWARVVKSASIMFSVKGPSNHLYQCEVIQLWPQSGNTNSEWNAIKQSFEALNIMGYCPVDWWVKNRIETIFAQMLEHGTQMGQCEGSDQVLSGHALKISHWCFQTSDVRVPPWNISVVRQWLVWCDRLPVSICSAQDMQAPLVAANCEYSWQKHHWFLCIWCDHSRNLELYIL